MPTLKLVRRVGETSIGPSASEGLQVTCFRSAEPRRERGVGTLGGTRRVRPLVDVRPARILARGTQSLPHRRAGHARRRGGASRVVRGARRPRPAAAVLERPPLYRGSRGRRARRRDQRGAARADRGHVHPVARLHDDRALAAMPDDRRPVVLVSCAADSARAREPVTASSAARSGGISGGSGPGTKDARSARMPSTGPRRSGGRTAANRSHSQIARAASESHLAQPPLLGDEHRRVRALLSTPGGFHMKVTVCALSRWAWRRSDAAAQPSRRGSAPIRLQARTRTGTASSAQEWRGNTIARFKTTTGTATATSGTMCASARGEQPLGRPRHRGVDQFRGRLDRGTVPRA